MSTFVCAVCHIEYRLDPSMTDEQRRAEYEATHGKPFPGTENTGLVCSECYPEVLAWARKKGLLP
jgi:hypothetical protein